MALPEDIWIALVSRSFPDAMFRLLTGVPVGDRSLELGEIVADDPGAAAAAIEDHPGVVAYEQLYLGEGRALARYEATEQRLYALLQSSSLPPQFPVVVEGGAMAFDVTATREQFDAFGTGLDASGFDYELLSVVHTDESSSLLTPRQRECLSVANRLGYFEVPRDCTLAELPRRSTSTPRARARPSDGPPAASSTRTSSARRGRQDEPDGRAVATAFVRVRSRDDGRGGLVTDSARDPSVAASAVSALTLTVAFGLLALGVDWFWVAFPVGFGGVLPLTVALDAAREGTASGVDVEEGAPTGDDTRPGGTQAALAELRRRYASGELTDDAFERKVEELLSAGAGERSPETSSTPGGRRAHERGREAEHQ
jgi:hypothetical protein